MSMSIGTNDSTKAIVEQLRSLWYRCRFSVTPEIRNEIGRYYMTTLLRLRPIDVDIFLTNASINWSKVGMAQNNLAERPRNLEAFWQQVDEQIPDLHNPNQIKFLVEEGGSGAVLEFLQTIQGNAPHTELLPLLAANLHTEAK